MNFRINILTLFLLKGFRIVLHFFDFPQQVSNTDYPWIFDGYCNEKDQAGNDAILHILEEYKGGGLMMSKWGTYELAQVVATYFHDKGLTFSDIIGYLKCKINSIDESSIIRLLYYNAGVFPMDIKIARKFAILALDDCRLIDILGSYIQEESVLVNVMKPQLRVGLDAFYAPWLFKNPWTKWLEGKKVLVVHPFVESISHQYNNNRTRLFDNPDVLPEFESLTCIKAVQTQAGEKCQFKDWFEALDYMKRQIDKCDYNVAIIGCGAYGMSLAAHVKRQGKVALHLAGWTQMLFGVYGERWVSHQSKYSSVINKYWIRPNKSENLKNGGKIEGGCYW